MWFRLYQWRKEVDFVSLIFLQILSQKQEWIFNLLLMFVYLLSDMKSRVRKVSGMGQGTADYPPQGKNDLVKIIHVLTVKYNRAIPDYVFSTHLFSPYP